MTDAALAVGVVDPVSAHARAAERQRRRWAACTARQLRLIGPATMFDAIWEAGVHLFPAEMEVRFARMAHRPAAHAIIKIEQAGLVRDFRAGLGRNQAARRGRGDRRLLVTRTLAQESAGADRNDARRV